MPDQGICGTIEEPARRERVNRGDMTRVLRLTLLAPDVVKAILDGRQAAGLRLDDLLKGLPPEWQEQRTMRRSGRCHSGDTSITFCLTLRPPTYSRAE